MRGRDSRSLALDRHLFKEKQRQQRYAPRGQPERRAKPKPRRTRRVGLMVVSFLLAAFSTMMIFQLYQIQIVTGAEYAQKAGNLHYKRETEYPTRGRIYDSNGVELAGTTYVYRIGITPKDVYSISKIIKDEVIAENIAICLNLKTADVLAEMQKTKETYILLKKDVTREEAEALKAYKKEFKIGGIKIEAEPRRYYTNGSLASQVIGFSSFSGDNLVGKLGVEMEYNSILTGEPGYTYVETDSYTGGGLPFSVPTSLRAKNGQNLILNIDINIQKIAQEELENAINVYDITKGGSVIIMDPFTGAVLGMASYPYFNSSDPTACPAWADAQTWDYRKPETMEILTSTIWNNHAISDSYEPGSTMKAITAAIALEEGLAREDEIMSDASISLMNSPISCAHKPNHGMETMQRGFWNSCNPIFAQLALRTGVSRYYDYIRGFGFLGVTDIDLPAEGTGIFHANPTPLDMATLSYGESSTVTPLQLATAYCVFANGGNLVTPTIVKAITNSDGNIIKENTTTTVRKVISEETSSRIRELLKGVVLYGTGSAAYVEGYSIAGKTSTSTDNAGDHTLSFAGIAPADNPEIVVLVVLNIPASKDLTSKAASKTSGQIISRTLEYMGISREYTEKDVSRLQATSAVPNVVGSTYKAAMDTLLKKGFRIEAGDSTMTSETIVKFQWPAAATQLHSSGLIVLYPQAAPAEKMTAVPDFTGRNVSECLSLAAQSGLNIKIVGDCLGVAASQDIAPTFTAEGIEAPGAVRLKRGSLVAVSFAAVEEEVAQ